MNFDGISRVRILLGLVLGCTAGVLVGGCAVVDAGNAVAGVADQVSGSIDSAATAPGKATASSSTQGAAH
jgi:hypothetical protein